jgi:hypothetical protein
VYGRNYPAYSFTNYSEDILGLFASAWIPEQRGEAAGAVGDDDSRLEA